MTQEAPARDRAPAWRSLPGLLGGDPGFLRAWLEGDGSIRWRLCIGTIICGAGLFGASVGCWRSDTQAVITAIKLPLILLLTAAGNAAVNGLLAPLLGLNLGFRQAALAVLLSFTLAAVILGSLAPILAFVVWNLPPMAGEAGRDRTAHGILLLTAVATVAFAGVVANVRLLRMLQSLAANRSVARRILVAWLATNLLLGTQLSWIARPFFGHPNLPVQFLRADAFSGNFFEATLFAARRVLQD